MDKIFNKDFNEAKEHSKDVLSKSDLSNLKLGDKIADMPNILVIDKGFVDFNVKRGSILISKKSDLGKVSKMYFNADEIKYIAKNLK